MTGRFLWEVVGEAGKLGLRLAGWVDPPLTSQLPKQPQAAAPPPRWSQPEKMTAPIGFVGMTADPYRCWWQIGTWIVFFQEQESYVKNTDEVLPWQGSFQYGEPVLVK